MRWQDAVLEAIVRVTDTLGSSNFTRQQLLEHELVGHLSRCSV